MENVSTEEKYNELKQALHTVYKHTRDSEVVALMNKDASNMLEQVIELSIKKMLKMFPYLTEKDLKWLVKDDRGKGLIVLQKQNNVTSYALPNDLKPEDYVGVVRVMEQSNRTAYPNIAGCIESRDLGTHCFYSECYGTLTQVDSYLHTLDTLNNLNTHN